MESTRDLIGRFGGTLEGQVALVTGAGSGIGRACAEALARASADVALMGRREPALDETATLVEAAGRRALVIAGDATTRRSTRPRRRQRRCLVQSAWRSPTRG
jgi:NAD(P)-dependent dehydrogenase (short-subunit alcohol dehydrogenase family)